jgi:hypothetical protein
MRTARIPLRFAIAFAVVAVLVLPARADTARGTWNITNVHGTLQLEMRWQSPDGRGNNDHSSYIDAKTLGIADALKSPGKHATFALHREAGDFAFEGWLGNGEGAGSYTFTPNDAFFASLRKRGYDITTMDFEMAFADLDITTKYVDEMESLGFKGDVSNLVALKALNVSQQYVRDLQGAGVTDITTPQIIALRALHVDRAYVSEIAAAGFPRLEASQYVTLKAMHVDGAYIRYLRSHGFKNLTVDQVVGMKAERI